MSDQCSASGVCSSWFGLVVHHPCLLNRLSLREAPGIYMTTPQLFLLVQKSGSRIRQLLLDYDAMYFRCLGTRDDEKTYKATVLGHVVNLVETAQPKSLSHVSVKIADHREAESTCLFSCMERLSSKLVRTRFSFWLDSPICVKQDLFGTFDALLLMLATRDETRYHVDGLWHEIPEIHECDQENGTNWVRSCSGCRKRQCTWCRWHKYPGTPGAVVFLECEKCLNLCCWDCAGANGWQLIRVERDDRGLGCCLCQHCRPVSLAPVTEGPAKTARSWPLHEDKA
jgi:hypothetical protein